MNIHIAEFAGACFGVERALQLVKKATEEHKSITTLGPLIHNPRVVNDLNKHDIASVESVDEVNTQGVVLRTHGVSPEVVKRAQEKELSIIDATCPFVKKVHHAAQKLIDEKYQVFILGEKGHAEVEGILGYAPSAYVVNSVEELEALHLPKRVGVIVQTTQNKHLLHKIVAYLLDHTDDLKVLNTICDATSKRQDAALKLASKVDTMLVIGGKNSANTTRLFEICQAYCPNSHHIEKPEDIDPDWLKDTKELGITAGASTPEEHISEVILYLREL